MSNKLIELVFDRVMNRKFTLLRKIALTFFSSPSANRSRMAQTGNGAQPGLDELNEVALSLDDGGKLSGQLCDLFYFRLALWTSCHHHYYLFQWACYVILNKWHGHGDWCRYYLIVTGLLSMLRKIQRRRRRQSAINVLLMFRRQAELVGSWRRVWRQYRRLFSREIVPAFDAGTIMEIFRVCSVECTTFITINIAEATLE